MEEDQRLTGMPFIQSSCFTHSGAVHAISLHVLWGWQRQGQDPAWFLYKAQRLHSTFPNLVTFPRAPAPVL